MGLSVEGGPRGSDFLSGHTLLKDYPFSWNGAKNDDWSFVYTVSGSGSVEVEGSGSLEASPGSAIMIQPGILPRFTSKSGDWEIFWLHFVLRPHMDAATSWGSPVKGLHATRVPEASRTMVEASLKEILSLEPKALPSWRELAYNILENLVLRCSAFAQSGAPSLDARLRKALELLHSAPASSVNASRLAASCGLSRASLFSLFREQAGCSPRKYLEGLKMEKARRLLERSSLSVGEIAVELGFPSIYYFSSRFSKATGCSPLAYRSKFRTKSMLS